MALKNDNENGNKRFPDGFRILQGTQEYITYPMHSSVRIWPSADAYYYADHWHSAVEILLCTKGEIIYMTDGHVYHVSEGQILILPPECRHAMTIPENSYRYLFLFEPDPFISMRDTQETLEWLREPVYLCSEPELQKQISDILMETLEIYNAKAPLWNTECYSCFFRIFVLLGKHFMRNERAERPQPGRSAAPELMNSVMTYIDQNYKENLTLEQVAEFSGFSKYYFSRMFNGYTGCTFVEYLNRKRISVADYMLINTDKPVSSVAGEAGFGSVATFNRIFRNMHGCTPSRFRAIYGEY